MIEVLYTQRENNNAELISFTRENTTYEEACKIIDEYPYESEFKWFEETGEGGGLYFLLGKFSEAHAYFQFVPMEKDRGLLSLEINLKKGFLGIGSKSKELDFDMLGLDELKTKLYELFIHDLDSLYEKYR